MAGQYYGSRFGRATCMTCGQAVQVAQEDLLDGLLDGTWTCLTCRGRKPREGAFLAYVRGLDKGDQEGSS